MAPESRQVPRFAAEPPQELDPYGRWGERLRGELLGACLRISTDGLGELGDVGAVTWFPDRTWHGRTYLPATAQTSTGLEIFGFVSWTTGDDDGAPNDLDARADATDETAERNPEWTLDLCDEVVGSWRGEQGKIAAMTLVWGRPLVTGGAIVTAELAGLTVDQCALIDDRFTLLAPDDYRGDMLDVKLFSERSVELALESLYADDGEE